MICRLFIGKKFRKKFTPTPTLYPSSKSTDSGEPAVVLVGVGKVADGDKHAEVVDHGRLVEVDVAPETFTHFRGLFTNNHHNY